MAKNNLNIFLIKKDIQEFENIVEDDASLLAKFDDDSIVYYKSSYVREPDWLSGFFKLSNKSVQISNARAVFLKRVAIKSEKRIFALTFGYGRTLLKNDVIEEQFGLKIVLNSIDKNNIRKISKTDIGKNYKQSQEQMPKASPITEFGFDIDRDLVRTITGRTNDYLFGEVIITGGDSFNISIEKNVENIEDFLIGCFEKYNSERYKENFSWIDNIKQVKNSDLIDKLNNQIVSLFNQRMFEEVWLAIPEIIDWTNVKTIQYGKNIDDIYDDINVETFMKTFKNETIENFSQIKNRNISIISNDGNEIIKWSCSYCIVGSITFDDDVYAINGGKWYKINRDFAKEINDSYDRIKISNIDFPICPSNTNEDGYNEYFVEKNKKSHLIHTYKIPYGGGSGNNIEPCDIMIGKTMIHVKKNGGSSYLSHLFNQASNSCQCLLDSKFRNIFKDKLRKNNVEDLLEDNFNARDYTIVLAIINKYNDELPRIPFFSKVSIRYASQLIQNLGYKFEIKNIYKENSINE